MEQKQDQTAKVIQLIRNTITFKETLVKLTTDEIRQLNLEIDQIKQKALDTPELAENGQN